MSVRLNLPPSYRLAMQHTNTPAWEAASTAASTRPRRIEREERKQKKKQSNSHASYSFLVVQQRKRK